MLWVALHCPTLPLDRIRRRLPEAVVPAIAIAAAVGNRRWISMANASAQRQGVAARQPVATALALCPELVLIERDEADEQEALRAAALAALCFTPSVSLVQNGVLMEIASSLRLFGGQRALLGQIRNAFDALGLATAIGVAPTARGALLLAAAARPGQPRTATAAHLEARLDALPVDLLESAQDHLATLAGIGCTCLAHLRSLPRSGLARRFGPRLLSELDEAYGLRAEPRAWFTAPERFEVRLELAARVEHAEALLFATRRLTLQLAGWLTARHAATGRITLTLHHAAWRRAASAQTAVILHLSQPCRDPLHLHGLLRERLSALVLDAPIEELSLAADDVGSVAAPNQELFPTPQSEAVTVQRLVEKLRARLGHAAVLQVGSHADHRPEKAWQVGAAPAAGNGPAPSTPSPRPAWLLKTPRPLTVRGHRPCHGTALSLLAGPERIEAGWWDDALVARDYYIAENQQGQLLWIYRERKAEDEAHAWYLHGLFA
jgi:protein ImuB